MSSPMMTSISSREELGWGKETESGEREGGREGGREGNMPVVVKF